MLKYLLSLSILLLCTGSWAQKTDEELSKEEKKLANKGEPGLAFGLDLAPFINHLFSNERFGVEANVRYTINRKWQAVGEIGYENVDMDTEQMNYTSDGSFARVGVDYNIFRVEEVGNNDNILLGVRYGASIQEHSCPRYTVEEVYWGNVNGSFSPSTVASHWGEFVFGLRSEVLKNFYMGWTVRFKTILNVGADNELEPYSVPGYGRRDRPTNMGFTYTLEYQIPFKKDK
ncbi:DUF6048 family protein [Carboxylicivirga sp. M1479]|uniref:DUF6048 family protein n=1 Tax=Carboxylicivirga sp. M1479 TaxID=2594476 RepID=UPI00117891C0|nr:DUF6048 family protein [Carboxylicivirga sp. M1479]TRX72428.1 hypothetical protein FNN09_00385 [Carboxylicivirga sp. M1479]